MKLVKKIIRLLPIFSILAPYLTLIFNKGVFNGLSSLSELHNYLIDCYSTSLQIFYGPILKIREISPFSGLFTWWINLVGDNDFLITAFCIMSYELLVSLLFIMFDFINIVFNWANKFLKKGSDVD